VGNHIPVINEEECIACGNCEAVCPEVFRLNESLGHSEVVSPKGAPEEKIKDAMEQCPVQCIRWLDELDAEKLTG
jgi:ferredoxin